MDKMAIISFFESLKATKLNIIPSIGEIWNKCGCTWNLVVNGPSCHGHHLHRVEGYISHLSHCAHPGEIHGQLTIYPLWMGNWTDETWRFLVKKTRGCHRMRNREHSVKIMVGFTSCLTNDIDVWNDQRNDSATWPLKSEQQKWRKWSWTKSLSNLSLSKAPLATLATLATFSGISWALPSTNFNQAAYPV